MVTSPTWRRAGRARRGVQLGNSITPSTTKKGAEMSGSRSKMASLVNYKMRVTLQDGVWRRWLWWRGGKETNTHGPYGETKRGEALRPAVTHHGDAGVGRRALRAASRPALSFALVSLVTAHPMRSWRSAATRMFSALRRVTPARVCVAFSLSRRLFASRLTCSPRARRPHACGHHDGVRQAHEPRARRGRRSAPHPQRHW